MGYDYGFDFTVPDAVEGAAEGALIGAAGVFTGIFLLLYLVAMAFSVVSYVLNAVGMYRIAKRRGIHHAWLSWIPIGCNWLLGSISDHYQYVVKQKQTKRRSILLWLGILMYVVFGVFAGGFAGVILAANAGAEAGASILAVAAMSIGYLGALGLAIAVTVFCYIAYYDLFRSCKPKYDLMFLILGIVFNVTLPFFVFACSGADEGMPVRRAPQPPVQIPYQPAAAPAEEPAACEEEIPVVEAEVVEDPE